MEDRTMNEHTTTDHSATLGALAKALASAPGKMSGAKKAGQNPHLKNKYATLADVWDACREPLSAHGLAVVQSTVPHGKEGVGVVTTLVHESGEWMRSHLFLPVTKADAQGFGSALTYARRYALAAMVGVAPDDDDGEVAVGRTNGTSGPVKAAPSDETEQRLAALLDGAQDTDALAKAEAAAARAAKAGELTDAARARLREKRAAAVSRVGAAA
jgi:hypothetical protein